MVNLLHDINNLCCVELGLELSDDDYIFVVSWVSGCLRERFNADLVLAVLHDYSFAQAVS